MSDDALTIELFADVLCPFTHVGLRRFVHRRERAARDVVLWVRAWPLEVVNGEPLTADFVASEVDALRASVASDLFTGFDPTTFPSTSLPTLALSAAAARLDLRTGEQVALELRDLVFERGVDVSDPDVLAEVANRFGVHVEPSDAETVLADRREGETRGVVGSPHFFTPDGSFFCPSLDISHDADGTLQVRFDQAGFQRFVDACFG
jgi:predicted DsbA family dithiol-disulfide isomerase